MDISAESIAAMGIIAAIIMLLFVFALVGVLIVSQWKLFEKCGEKGWKSIIPYYNDWTLVELSGCHWWYFLIIIGNSLITLSTGIVEMDGVVSLISGIINLASIYAILCVNYNIAKRFNQGIAFAIGMCFVPFVFYWILGFSNKYQYDKNVQVNAWGLYDFENKKSDLNTNKSYCSNCGSEVISNFCPKCGKSKKGD